MIPDLTRDANVSLLIRETNVSRLIKDRAEIFTIQISSVDEINRSLRIASVIRKTVAMVARSSTAADRIASSVIIMTIINAYGLRMMTENNSHVLGN